MIGLINKADYTFGLAGFRLQPKVKSEYLNQTAFEARAEDREEWVGTGIVLLSHPLLSQSLVETGVEFSLFRDLILDEDEQLANGPAGPTGDFRNLVLALQWSSAGSYLGYRLTTQFGFSYTRLWEERVIVGSEDLERTNEVSAFSTSFITVYAGLE